MTAQQLYLLRDDATPRTDDLAGYIDTDDEGMALAGALTKTRCDECAGPISRKSRTVMVHASTIDHQETYLTVVCPLCLPTVADRLSLR